MAEALTRRSLLTGFHRLKTDRPLAVAGDRGAGAGAYRIAAVSQACLENRGTTCRLCADLCDEQAIRFRPRLGGSAIVSIDVDTCTGCGACVGSCPARAISLITPPVGAIA